MIFTVTVCDLVCRYTDLAYIEGCVCAWRVCRSESTAFGMSHRNIMTASDTCTYALSHVDASKQCGFA